MRIREKALPTVFLAVRKQWLREGLGKWTGGLPHPVLGIQRAAGLKRGV